MERGDLNRVLDAKLPKVVRLLVRGELKRLPSLLDADETLLNLAAGELNGTKGLLILTDRRVAFLDAGIVRLNVQEIPRTSVSSVTSTRHGIRAALTITASGVPMTVEKLNPFQRVDEMVATLRAQPTSGVSMSAPAGTADDPMVALSRAKQMLDAGLIGQDEYDAVKVRILAAMG